MAKKSRKAKAKIRAGQQPTGGETKLSVTTNTAPVFQVSKPVTGGTSATALASRHKHVPSELRRISIIAGILFIIIIILTFIIT